MRRWIPYLTALVLFIGCNRGEYIDVVSLGALEKEIVLSSGAADGTIDLITNVPYEVQVPAGDDWLVLAATGMMPSSRTELPFRCRENNGWKRMAKVTLSASDRVDTVYVKQEGPLTDRISLKDKSFNVPSEGGTYTTEVECFRYPDGMLVDLSNPAWEASIQGNILTVKAAPATSRDPKVYTVTVYYLDGWGERAEAVATFNQSARK